MNKTTFIYLLIVVYFVSCKEPEPRRPVQNKSGTFYKESVERNKLILKREESLIKSLIQADTLNEYIENPYGFWYFYEIRNDSLTRTPITDDEVILTYNLMSFNGDTIYKRNDIGMQQIKIDKTQLFPGLRNAIKLLKQGEKATFLFPSSQVYGYKGDNNKIGPNVPLKSSLELVQIINSIEN